MKFHLRPTQLVPLPHLETVGRERQKVSHLHAPSCRIPDRVQDLLNYFTLLVGRWTPTHTPAEASLGSLDRIDYRNEVLLSRNDIRHRREVVYHLLPCLLLPSVEYEKRDRCHEEEELNDQKWELKRSQLDLEYHLPG